MKEANNLQINVRNKDGLLQNTLGVTKITFGENLFLFGVLEITFGVLGAGLFMNKTGQERTLFLPC